MIHPMARPSATLPNKPHRQGTSRARRAAGHEDLWVSVLQPRIGRAIPKTVAFGLARADTAL
jgi:hypothetical protein